MVKFVSLSPHSHFGRRYGKRSADAEPEPDADADPGILVIHKIILIFFEGKTHPPFSSMAASTDTAIPGLSATGIRIPSTVDTMDIPTTATTRVKGGPLN